MIACSPSGRWQLVSCLVVLLLMTASPTTSADDSAATKPSTRPAATKPAEERERDRLIAVQQVTIAAIEYAVAHDQAIPTTEELAKHMEVAPDEFQYRVVPTGSLEQHMERVKGDWPEVLIAEKRGGEDGKWAFGFVDGMCTIQTIEGYEKMRNFAAIQAISKPSTRPSSEP